jgi:hypothetical protein
MIAETKTYHVTLPGWAVALIVVGVWLMIRAWKRRAGLRQVQWARLANDPVERHALWLIMTGRW